MRRIWHEEGPSLLGGDLMPLGGDIMYIAKYFICLGDDTSGKWSILYAHGRPKEICQQKLKDARRASRRR